MEDPKKYGRQKRPQIPKTFNIDDDLVEYPNKTGNQDAFVNMIIRNYKQQAEKIISQINKIL